MQIKTFREAEHKLINLIEAIKQEADIKHLYKYQGINDPLAKQLGVEIVEQALHNQYGLYMSKSPITGMPTITIDPNGSDEERLNFTYFHEVAHHVIRSDDELYGFIDEMAGQNEDLNTLKERFANIGAAEFLLPGEAIKEAINENSFSIKLLLELDKTYPASKPSIAIQLARQAIHKCFVIVCEYGQIPSKGTGQAELTENEKSSNTNYLYVRYAASSPSNKYSIGQFVVIPNKHLLSNVFVNKLPLRKGKDSIPFRSRTEWDAECEGMYYKGKVYAVFNLETPPPPANLQPELFKL
jgi:Zn-dependent peptidase ImmA (M78 family)